MRRGSGEDGRRGGEAKGARSVTRSGYQRANSRTGAGSIMVTRRWMSMESGVRSRRKGGAVGTARRTERDRDGAASRARRGEDGRTSGGENVKGRRGRNQRRERGRRARKNGNRRGRQRRGRISNAGLEALELLRFLLKSVAEIVGETRVTSHALRANEAAHLVAKPRVMSELSLALKRGLRSIGGPRDEGHSKDDAADSAIPRLAASLLWLTKLRDGLVGKE